MKNIAVVGAGIIGLTSAATLLKAGHRITIYCERLPMQTTSVKAGAIWLPFLTEPRHLVNQWAKYSYEIFCRQFAEHTEGIQMVELNVFANDQSALDYDGLIPGDAMMVLKKDELPSGAKAGCRMKVPLIEPPLYLAALEKQLQKSDVKIIQQKINSLNALHQFDCVINCTGLGARWLVNDESVIPVSGQIVKTEKIENAICFTDKTDTDHPVYLFPRNDGCILGGSAVRNDFSEEPLLEMCESILSRVSAFEQRVRQAKIISEYVGLRPWRPSVRLEKEERNQCHSQLWSWRQRLDHFMGLRKSD